MTEINDLIAVFETDKGTIRVKLFGDKVPITVSNFINLANRKFYKGLNFHRVIGDFMIQGGCPSGTGTGGPGYNFQDEFVAELKHSKPGILSMANAGPGTNGSQFFITHIPTPHLDQHHTVFGEVVDQEDQDVVNSIRQGDKLINIIIEGDTSAITETTSDMVNVWNEKLDQLFPNLKAV